jgi:hypothetical protein
MNKTVYLLIFGIIPVLFSCGNKSNIQENGDVIMQSSNAGSDSVSIDGAFSIPELFVQSSPENSCHYTFPASENVVDYDVSPVGGFVAVIVKKEEKSYLKFWKPGSEEILEMYALPDNLDAKAIAWHPTANAIFVMGSVDANYHIYKVEKNKEDWTSKSIFSSTKQLRRLVACPRPFITKWNFQTQKYYYNYRLFFGMDNGNKTYRTVSITDNGGRFYQVIGPAETATRIVESIELYDEELPSYLKASSWALPLAFHPAGHELIWEDNSGKFQVATYSTDRWWGSNPLKINLKGGTITPTPNGLGFIHWQKDKPGIGVFLISKNSEESQLTDYRFVSTPSSVPDGKGIVGLTKTDGAFVLHYLPVNMPLADVTNAWMYIRSTGELDLFKKNYGLFRPDVGNQLYQLYESENYYCNSYDRSSPTRPYLVTTDIFWELFGAAYQGLFVIKEQDEAIPNFWSFVDAAHSYFKNKPSKWDKVFTVLTDLKQNNKTNPEVGKIFNEGKEISLISGEEYAYYDLKPRGHYTSSPEMENYFKAFRYFTTILKEDKESIGELENLPSDITKYAENWINSYAGFIAPGNSPLVWKKTKRSVPSYCRYPQSKKSLFPLSWGFDNEVFYSTVYHSDIPKELQIKDRMLPSGLDIAAAMGNGFAENLLSADFDLYPPLRKVINNLKNNFKENTGKADFQDNLYNQWLNAMSVQWADSKNSPNGEKDYNLWNTKRLQTGLATWATLRHATVLVNSRGAAECGEGGFEAILMRAPRGYVEPDPQAFAAIAKLFEETVQYVSETTANKSDDILYSENYYYYDRDKKSLYDGIIIRLKEAADNARQFQAMAEKQLKGELLNNDENEKILFVGRVAEHLFLIFNSLSQKDLGLANPDPIAKIVDVASVDDDSPFLMAAVGNAMEWNHVVPFYGRKQIVKGSVYSYYEFSSGKILNDNEWREQVDKQDFPFWVKPFVSKHSASEMAETGY